MAHAANQILVVEFRCHINNVAAEWTYVKDRRANLQDVIYFAWMNDPGERIAHNHNVQIRSRKRASQLAQRLIRKTKNISQLVPSGVSLNLLVLAAAAYKTKRNLIAIREFPSRAKQSVQRMTGTVISGVHHHKLS